MTIVELRRKVGMEILSNPEFDGTKESFGNLDASEQIQITNAMKEYIRLNPDEFTSTQKNIAELGDTPLPEKFGIKEAASSFGTEFKKQGEKIAAKSGIGFNGLLLVIGIVGVAVGLTQLTKIIPSKK